MILEERYTLSNGVEIPRLGLGTWFINNGNAADAVKNAAKAGYRHIDTAQAYRNEGGVGIGIKSCGVHRDEMFVTTKLAAGVKSYKKATEEIERSLRTMGLDHIDMMIIHSPQPWRKFRGDDRFLEGNREAWRALEEAYTAGKLRAIGLSNFEAPDIDNILQACTVAPMVNQVLAHVGNMPTELIEYSTSNGMLVEAYSPIAHGELMKRNDVEKIAANYGVTVPQLSIRFLLQLGLLPLPKTTKPAHMRSNADVDFVISDEDMRFLANIEPLDDYGSASAMPVYGGKMTLKSMFSMLVHSIRS
ncbi:MAG: aldo/keto reductase [Actinomycetota bacterium]|nr:aldo/keto reductase [Actinomycetota bacterium]